MNKNELEILLEVEEIFLKDKTPFTTLENRINVLLEQQDLFDRIKDLIREKRKEDDMKQFCDNLNVFMDNEFKYLFKFFKKGVQILSDKGKDEFMEFIKDSGYDICPMDFDKIFKK
jgi:hypothetical protein